jgi:hypothetical protein
MGSRILEKNEMQKNKPIFYACIPSTTFADSYFSV